MYNLLLLVLVIQLVPKTSHTPTIKHIQDGFHIATNPLDYPVKLVVDCGFKYEKISIRLEANSRQEVEVKDSENDRNLYNVCFLDSYDRVKEKE